MCKEQPRADLLGNTSQISIAPGGNVSRNNANLHSVSAPTQAEAITIGWNDRCPRQQALSNQRISGVNNNSSISNFGPA
jgi:hypothetical protein